MIPLYAALIAPPVTDPTRTLYAIARRTHETYGHGDCGTEFRICRMGAWGTGGFPPLFTTPDRAEAWIARNYRLVGSRTDLEIVPLTILD